MVNYANVDDYFASIGATTIKSNITKLSAAARIQQRIQQQIAKTGYVAPSSSSSGTAVIPNTAGDATLQQLELQRRTQEVQNIAENLARTKRIDIAKQTASLSTQALALQQQERQNNLSREMANLSRTARQARANVLSGSANAGIIGTSAYRGARSAVGANLTREQGYLNQSEALAKQSDALKTQEIQTNLSTAITNNQALPTVSINPTSGFVEVKGASSELLSALGDLQKTAQSDYNAIMKPGSTTGGSYSYMVKGR